MLFTLQITVAGKQQFFPSFYKDRGENDVVNDEGDIGFSKEGPGLLK